VCLWGQGGIGERVEGMPVAMQHAFDLTGKGICKFQFFLDAVAAFQVPATVEETFSLLLWGVVFPKPEQDEDFCGLLRPAVRAALPTALYLSGWGMLSFRGVQSGEAKVWPYEPTFDLHDLKFPAGNGSAEGIVLFRSWSGASRGEGVEYVFSMVLEQPLGFLALKVVASGPVTLCVDPHDFVTEQQLEEFPQRNRFDLTRRRQMARMAAAESDSPK
jgi:hypothetical protein